ncbi:uncharacterized protein LOC105181458 [Harpegnathos saltator]|uniref:uncharacterized protein LOC105181458 n=1 Tax=Harpegnathos saltator TaxID=610380 RepID=UPI000DBED89B|nr:uncharacterized protein LOC105181458 [Harpegnathos saltator]
MGGLLWVGAEVRPDPGMPMGGNDPGISPTRDPLKETTGPGQASPPSGDLEDVAKEAAEVPQEWEGEHGWSPTPGIEEQEPIEVELQPQRKRRGKVDPDPGTRDSSKEDVRKANLGGGVQAQDLWSHRILELDAALRMATEPHWVPRNSASWFGSPDGLVAVVANPGARTPPCELRERGSSFVAIDYGPITVMGVYLHHHKNIVGLGSSPRPPRQRDPRGEAVIDWAVGLDLLLMNRESASTCVQPEGESVIDLTWAFPSAAWLFQEWKVEV